MNNCAECHQASGRGITGAIPPLDANPAVTAAQPTDIVTAVLGGLPGNGDYGHMPAFGAALDDRQVADAANFIRTAWSNEASANATPEMVAGLRGEVGTMPQASEAARALGCPAITETGASDALPEPAKGILNGFTGVTDAEMANRIGELIHAVQAGGTTGNAAIVNALFAAYCPIVAEDSALSAAQKRARLDAFNKGVQEALAARAAPAGAHILVQVPLPPDTVSKVDAAASAAKETRQKWLADAISEAAEGRGGN
jgi:cytochrome c553